MSDAVDDFRGRVASGSTKLATRLLAAALAKDSTDLPKIARMLEEENPVLRACTARALAAHSTERPRDILPHVSEILACVHDENADAREAALRCLAEVAPLAPDAVALGLADIADEFAHAKKAPVREVAALCLARLGSAGPEHAALVVPKLAGALEENPRDKQARAILAAMSDLAHGAMAPAERLRVAKAVAPLRGHPDLQVRERAVQLCRVLGAA